MNISVRFQYPEKEPIDILIPNHLALHGYWKSIGFTFNEKLANGMSSLKVFHDNIRYMMIEKGLITEEAQLLSIEIKE